MYDALAMVLGCQNIFVSWFTLASGSAVIGTFRPGLLAVVPLVGAAAEVRIWPVVRKRQAPYYPPRPGGTASADAGCIEDVDMDEAPNAEEAPDGGVEELNLEDELDVVLDEAADELGEWLGAAVGAAAAGGDVPDVELAEVLLEGQAGMPPPPVPPAPAARGGSRGGVG